MIRILERIIDSLIDRIIIFTDYFIVKQHITLSETVLFAMSVIRTIWFGIFGVKMIEGQALVNHEAWFYVFFAAMLAHFVSFFFTNLIYRIIALVGVAFIWCFLGSLLLFAAVESPAVPTFLAFSALSVFIAVRLVREWRNG